MDDCCNTDSFVVAGVDNQLHDGRVHPHHTGDCHYCCDSGLHPGAKRVAKRILLSRQIQ